MKNHPKVSILTSVYNGEEFLREMLESVRNQTYTDWEFIVIDDCSTDGTEAILSEYQKIDGRIRVYRNEVNLRLAASLNKALSLANGIYAVRMDADDICRRDRLEKQVAFMEANPEISVSSCKHFALYGNQAIPSFLPRREDSEAIRAMLLFSCPIVHPGVVARLEDLKKMGYRTQCTCTEDLDLWLRLAAQGKKIAVQEEFLLLYRFHKNQITANTKEKQKEEYLRIIAPFYKALLFELNEAELRFLTFDIYSHQKPDMKHFLRFSKKIWKANKITHAFTEEGLRYAMFWAMLGHKRNGVPLPAVFWGLFHLDPRFLLREWKARKRRIQRNIEGSRRAAKLFGLEECKAAGYKIAFRKER